MSKYIVEDMLPLSTAHSPAFRKLIGGVHLTQVLGRKVLTLYLDKVFVSMEPKLKAILEKVDFVCTTANVWKACNRGFFSMTLHWIDPTTLQCCKAAISCTRLIGRNTYDVLAGKIESIQCQFELCGKVTATITDNDGSNIVKAFKTFSVDPTPSSTCKEGEQKEDNDQDEEEELTFENVCDALTLDPEKDDDYTQVEYELPWHERCAAYTLNLVASTDIDKSLSSSSLSKNSFAKSTSLWNKASRSTVASNHVEATKEKTNCFFIDSVEFILRCCFKDHRKYIG